ncbi:hypothetical protein [Corynebacterium kalinowskii]|uniref:hypothetical protein n=1 Tax=Corynebacterium kalinowskii TaxID=2675216 RepID=UPI0012E14F5C|nr:hypothetical protein [Corynebacterium kalinowskii]
MQIDLDDFFLGYRSWETLVELVHMLPQGSAYWAAVADDDELAELVIDSLKPNPRPPLHGWTSLHESLATIAEFCEAILAAVTNSDQPFRGQPRPEKAIERVEKRRLKSKGDALLRMVLGDRLSS